MKKIILVFLCLLIIPSFVMFNTFSKSPIEPNSTISSCMSLVEMKELMDSYGEKIIFYGMHSNSDQETDNNSVAIITYNDNTGTWSHFEILISGQVCYLNGGNGGVSTPPSLISS